MVYPDVTFRPISEVGADLEHQTVLLKLEVH